MLAVANIGFFDENSSSNMLAIAKSVIVTLFSCSDNQNGA